MVLIQAISGGVFDTFPRLLKRKTIVVLLLCLSGFITSLIYATGVRIHTQYHLFHGGHVRIFSQLTGFYLNFFVFVFIIFFLMRVVFCLLYILVFFLGGWCFSCVSKSDKMTFATDIVSIGCLHMPSCFCCSVTINFSINIGLMYRDEITLYTTIVYLYINTTSLILRTEK